MSTERVKDFLSKWNREGEVRELTVSTATSDLAAAALGVIVGRIAKSITLRHKENGALLLVVSGDARVDNKKFKKSFGFNPRMLSTDEALAYTGYAVGGICPFDIPNNVSVYLDESLRRYESVFPACGSSNSMIELAIDDLVEYSNSLGWVDVCNITAPVE
ncbi:EBSC protein [Deltaproteobacteria bacterium Smac51]|nr:EBSC protein [Deltaproteobacteria bacterium Smac51]